MNEEIVLTDVRGVPRLIFTSLVPAPDAEGYWGVEVKVTGPT
jgi:hypothetical protein